MAVGTILIYKLSSQNDIGYYEISTNDFDVDTFYISIDKSKKIVSFFLTKDFFKNPVRIIDYNKDEPIGSVPGIPMKVLTVTLMRSLEIFKTGSFPDFLHYVA